MKLSIPILTAVLISSLTVCMKSIFAQPFIPREQVVLDDALDPEFDMVGKQVAFAQRRPSDYNRLSIFVAQMNSGGTVDLDSSEFVGHMVPMWPNHTTPSNGPEWMYTTGKSQLVWTGWKNDSPASETWEIKHARKEADVWVVRTVPCTENRHSPKGSLNVGDSRPFIRYFAGIPGYPRRAVYFRRKYTCGTETVLPGTEDLSVVNTQAGIVPRRRALVYSLFDPATQCLQAAYYNDDTQYSELLTSSSETHISVVLPWIAPDLGNNYALVTLEVTPDPLCPQYLTAPVEFLDCHDWDRLGIYIKEGNEIIKLYELNSPNALLPKMASLDVFVFQGKSYILLLANEIGGSKREVWIMSVDGGFARRVTEDGLSDQPRDPEHYVTDETVWIYFNRGPQFVRAETGLGQ